jgi:AcrR family transcriptional regulator
MATNEPPPERRPRRSTRPKQSALARHPQLRRPPTEAHREKLEAIKVAAAELFFSAGYAATDLRSIADSAQMHVTSLYNYISGKEELLYLIMRDGMEGVAGSLDEAVEGIEDPIEQIHKALHSHLLHHLHRRHLAWISHVEVRSLTGEYRTEILRLRRRYESRWVQMLSNAMEAERIIDGDPRILAYGLLSVGQSLARWYEPGGRVPAESISKALADLMLFGLALTDSQTAGGVVS